MNIKAIFIFLLFSSHGTLADEVQCSDIPKEELQYDYDLYEDGGTLVIEIPSEFEEATFVTFRVDYGVEKKVSFWVATEEDGEGKLSAMVGVPTEHERLDVQVVYHYPHCFALLKARFENGERIE